MSKPLYEQPVLKSPYYAGRRHHALGPVGNHLTILRSRADASVATSRRYLGRARSGKGAVPARSRRLISELSATSAAKITPWPASSMNSARTWVRGVRSLTKTKPPGSTRLRADSQSGIRGRTGQIV